MRVTVERKNIRFLPEANRVVARYFFNGDERTIQLLTRVLALDEQTVENTLEHTLREFASRHRNISKLFERHFENVRHILEHLKVDSANLSKARMLLIGSYLTMEYSLESAALFNPSFVEDYDQSYLMKGQRRINISFRATGEGHISSIVFRRGILDANNNFIMEKVGDQIDLADITHKKLYDKARFESKMKEMKIPLEHSRNIMDALPERFDYYELTKIVEQVITGSEMNKEKKLALEEMTWLADSFYDVKFPKDTDISERVLFPVSESENRGIEDARFVKFQEDDGTQKVYATYTAYNGHTILPKLICTEDYYTFRVMPMHGEGAQNKNLALFPKKINGKYAMLARIDGVNNFLMYSDRITVWSNPKIIQEPKFPWEFTQVGNCGSPIWTEEGWLVVSHGVGPMRRYCLGASLLDLDDPSKEIGRLKEPLLTPNENEREGYVPNVVYSCGSVVHNGNLILPYAVSDYSSTYAVVNMDELITAIKK